MSGVPAFAQRREEDLVVDLGYRILHEDPEFLIVSKPAPLPVHAVGRFKEKNLLSLLQRSSEYVGFRLGIVNRLDSETSGLVIVSKSSFIAGEIGKQFEARSVEKIYLGIVFGEAPAEGTIDVPLGTVMRDENHVRIPDAAGQSALTKYRLIAADDAYSLLEIRPETGRTHQIRAHLASIGHPLVGDKIYIDSKIYQEYRVHGWMEWMEDKLKMPRLALHASRLGFNHPRTRDRIVFEDSMPDVMRNFLSSRKIRV